MTDKSTVYLDNAATSYPKPDSVHQVMGNFLKEYGANPGRGSYRMVHEVESQIAAARREVAEFFNAPEPSRVIFTLNATDALNIGIKGTLRPGDHVITTVIDHNSIVRPLNRMEKEGLITVTRLAPGDEGLVAPAAVKAALNSSTRLIATQHGSNVTGAIQPVAEIGEVAREKGILFLLDAAQTAGMWPVDLEEMKIDLLAVPGHKGLMGPAGTGALILGTQAELRPWREGGTGGDSSYPVQPEEYPHRLEAGTLNTPGIAGMVEGLRYIKQLGLESIREHDLSLVRRFAEPLTGNRKVHLYGPSLEAPRSSVISFNIEGRSPDEVAGIMDSSFNIAVRSGLHCAPGAHEFLGTLPAGAVRVSPGPFNTPEDMDRVVEAIQQIVG
jgi:cysteine desulfurase/selenocysteine lyase